MQLHPTLRIYLKKWPQELPERENRYSDQYGILEHWLMKWLVRQSVMLTDRRTDGQCHTIIRAKTSYKYREAIYQSFMQCCLTWPPEQVKVKSTHYKWWQSTCLEWLSDIHSTQLLDKHVFIETQTLWQDSNWEITSDADYQLTISFSKYKDNEKAQQQSKTVTS